MFFQTLLVFNFQTKPFLLLLFKVTMRKPVLENKEALVPGTAKCLRAAKMCWAVAAGAAPQQPYRQDAGRAFLLLLQSKYTGMCVPLSRNGPSHFVKSFYTEEF